LTVNLKKQLNVLAPFVFLSATLLSASPAWSFVIISNGGKTAYWPDPTNINYQLHNIPKPFVTPIENAFDVWTRIDGVNLSFKRGDSKSAPVARDGLNTISWVEEGWTGLSFRPPTNALAVTLSSFNASTGAIVDADIYFNAEYFPWAIIDGPGSSAHDVQNIATHEIGHLIGLDHSSVNLFESDPELYEATMFFASAAGETSRREPNIDDERGARHLYPAVVPPAASVTAVEKIEKFGNLYVYRVSGESFSEETSFLLTHGVNQVSDVVSRYRTIISSTEAEVQFNVTGFPSGEIYLVASNSPTQIGVFPMHITTRLSTDVGGLSTGSSGGCQIRVTDSSVVGFLSWAVLLVLTLAFLIVARRPFVRT